MDNISITLVTSFNEALSSQVQMLAKKIGSNFKPLSHGDVEEMIKSPSNYLFVAQENNSDRIVGMITLIVYRIPYVKKSTLEDLIVLEEYRGKGIATELVKKVLEKAKELRVSYIDFTSRPRREESNSLYEKLGFQQRDTNVFRLIIDYAEV